MLDHCDRCERAFEAREMVTRPPNLYCRECCAMNIEQAIKILNEHRHRNTNEWALNVHGEVAPEGSGVRMDYFTQFEAIAIARALADSSENGEK